MVKLTCPNFYSDLTQNLKVPNYIDLSYQKAKILSARKSPKENLEGTSEKQWQPQGSHIISVKKKDSDI